MRTLIELLENRALLSSAPISAVVAEDLLVVRNDRLRLHFDVQQAHAQAALDLRQAHAITRLDRKRVALDLRQLHLDRVLAPGAVPNDFAKLESDELQITTDIKAQAIIAQNDRETLALQATADKTTLGTDINTLIEARNSYRKAKPPHPKAPSPKTADGIDFNSVVRKWE